MTFTAKERRLMTALMKQPVIQQQDNSVQPFQAVPANVKLNFPDFPPVPNTGAQDYASYMLIHSSADKDASKLFAKSIASRDDSEDHRASLLNHLWDALSGPLYGAANVLDSLYPDENKSFGENLGAEAKGIGGAFLGTGMRVLGNGPVDEIINKIKPGFKDDVTNFEDKIAPKITSEDILHDRLGVDNKLLRYGGGFLLDMGIDPVSYVPLAPAIKALKQGPEAIKALMSGGAKAGPKAGALAPKNILNAKAAVTPGATPNIPLPPVYAHARAQAGGLAKPGFTMTRGNVPSALGRLNINGSQVGARGAATSLPAIPKIIPTPKFQLPEAAPVAEHAIKQSMIPRVDPTNIPRVNLPKTPIMDAARQAMAPPLPPTEQLASDVEKGLIDIPNPARSSVEKQQRAQNDWENAMLRQGVVQTPSGRLNIRAANQVVHDLASGNMPSNVIHPPLATGAVAQVGRNALTHVVTKTTDELPPGKQLQLFDKILTDVPDYEHARSALRAAEDAAIAQKIHPIWHDGVRVRLSDVLEATRLSNVPPREVLRQFGLSNMNKMSPEIRNAITHLTAQRSLNISEITANLSKHLTAAKDSINNYSPTIRPTLEDAGVVSGVKTAKELGMTNEEADAVRDLLKEVVDVDKIPADIWQNHTQASMQIPHPHHVPPQLVSQFTAQVANNVVSPQLAAQIGAQIGNGTISPSLLQQFVAQAAKGKVSPKLMAQINAQIAKAPPVSPQIIAKFNTQVAKGVGQTFVQLGQKITGAHVIDTVMTRMTTWWGRGPVKNYSQDVFTFGEQNAMARGTLARNLTKQFSHEERRVGMRVAQGVETSTDPNVNKIANIFKDYVQRLYDVSHEGVNLNMTTTQALSVAKASQLTMEDINQTIKDLGVLDNFQFVNTKHTPAPHFNGKLRDYSQGHDWMKSWETHKTEDPIGFIYNLDLATEIATKKYSLLDDAAGRWGSLTKDALHPVRSPLSRIHDFYFPANINDNLIKVMNDLEVKKWTPKSELGKFLADGQNMWKAGVTLYVPSSHVRNGMGDSFLMWLAGHNDPRAFIWSKRAIGAQKTRYRDVVGKNGSFDKLDLITNPNAKHAQNWAATAGSDIVLRSGGVSVNADQIFLGAYQRGLLKNVYAYEDLYAEAPLGGVNPASTLSKIRKTAHAIQPLGGRGRDTATLLAEYREHYIRIAHFASAVNKGLKKSKDLNAVMDAAAHEVRKWHPDGSDLTNFERQYLKTPFPFYSWVRKSTPLLMQSLVTAPAKHLVLPRGMLAVQNMLGIQGDSVLDPFPDDQRFPDWIKAYGIGPIGDAQSANIVAQWYGTLGKNMVDLDGKPYGYTIVNPGTPFQDFMQQFAGFGPMDTAAGIGESLSPGLKIPMDIMKNSDFTGAPISKAKGGQGVGHYLLKQIPGAAPIQRITDFGDRPRANQEPGFDKEALINYMTAMGLRGTSPYITGAEFEEKDRLRALKRAGK